MSDQQGRRSTPDDPLAGYDPNWRKKVKGATGDVDLRDPPQHRTAPVPDPVPEESAASDDPLAGYDPNWRATAPIRMDPVVVSAPDAIRMEPVVVTARRPTKVPAPTLDDANANARDRIASTLGEVGKRERPIASVPLAPRDAVQVGAPPNPRAKKLVGGQKLASDVFSALASPFEHPVETAVGLAKAPIESAYRLGTGLVQGRQDFITDAGLTDDELRRSGEDPDANDLAVATGMHRVTPEEGRDALLQTALLGGGGRVVRHLLGGGALAAGASPRVAGAVGSIAEGGAVGAAYSPDNRAVGGIVGGVAGGLLNEADPLHLRVKPRAEPPAPSRIDGLLPRRPAPSATARPAEELPLSAEPDYVAEPVPEGAALTSRIDAIRRARAAQQPGATPDAPVVAPVADPLDVTPPTHMAVRVGAIGPDGATFVRGAEAVTGAPEAAPYDLRKVKIAPPGDAAAARAAGYDGIEVPGDPPSVFIWNIRTVTPAAATPAPAPASDEVAASSAPAQVGAIASVPSIEAKLRAAEGRQPYVDNILGALEGILTPASDAEAPAIAERLATLKAERAADYAKPRKGGKSKKAIAEQEAEGAALKAADAARHGEEMRIGHRLAMRPPVAPKADDMIGWKDYASHLESMENAVQRAGDVVDRYGDRLTREEQELVEDAIVRGEAAVARARETLHAQPFYHSILDTPIDQLPGLSDEVSAHAQRGYNNPKTAKAKGDPFFDLSAELVRNAPEWWRQARQLHTDRSNIDGIAAALKRGGLESEKQAEYTAIHTKRVADYEARLRAIEEGRTAYRAAVGTTKTAVPAKKEYDYSSTQLDLPPEHAAGITALAAKIPDADLAKDGRESEPHITVKYGLHGNEPETVRALLADEPPITVTLGKTSIFPDSGSGDVVKVDIDSPALHALNKKIADALPHTDTHPEYKPHATVAYVKQGLGKKYAGDASLAGQTITLDKLTFSGKDGNKVEIPLGGKSAAAPPGDDFPLALSEDDLPYRLAEDAYRWNSMTPERRAKSEQREYVQHIRAVYQELAPLARTPEQQATLATELERYRQGYLERTKTLLAATSRTASAMVTGPAKFPTARNRKALEREAKVRTEFIEWTKRAQAAMRKAVVPESSGRVSSDDPDAVGTLTKKIADARELHDKMKTINRMLGAGKTMKGYTDEQMRAAIERLSPQLRELGMSAKEIADVLAPDYMGNIGFPSYRLQNNLANIKRMEQRVAELSRARTETSREVAFDGGRLIDNVEDNRIQIAFDAKPGGPMITELKQAAFKWAPSVGVWQRQRTVNARIAAEQLLGVKFAAARQAATTSEFDTPEIRAIEARAAAIPSTDTIDTPERNEWRHQQIDRMARFTKASRVAHIVMGHAGSGKSSLLAEPLTEATGAALLDSDLAKMAAPEYDGGLGATALHGESAQIRQVALERVVAQGGNLVFPTRGDPKGTVALARALIARGYAVHVHMMDVPPEVSARRVLAGYKAGTRHFVSPRAILQWGDSPRRAFAALSELDGVTTHDPLDNDVPRGTEPHTVADWRERWGFPDAEPPGGDAALRPDRGPDRGPVRGGRPGPDAGGTPAGAGGATEGAADVAAPSGLAQVVDDDGRTRFLSARAPSGGMRPVARVSTRGLLQEFIDLEVKRADAESRAVYEVREDPNFHTSGIPQIVSTKPKGGGPSMQAKAAKNLEGYQAITDRVFAELATRMPADEVWERIEDLRAVNDERAGVAGDFSAAQRGNELRDESGAVLFSRPESDLPDLFGESPRPSAADQGSLFGEQAGTEAARSLRQSESAAREELTRLRPVAAAPGRVGAMAKARIAELEKLVNRDKAISAEELRTRAGAEQEGLSLMRTGEGKVGAGFDKSLFQKLGANLYKGDLGVVALKEGLQNASDSLIGRADGVIRVDYTEKQGDRPVDVFTRQMKDKYDEDFARWMTEAEHAEWERLLMEPSGKVRVLTIEDNGHGMSPETMETAFVDIGGSEKEAGAAGGYGLAKVSLFSHAEQIEAVSVRKMPNGTIVETRLTGSGKDWQDGEMRLETKRMLGDDKHPTGTKLRLTFGKAARADAYNMRAWLEALMEFRTTPWTIQASIQGETMQKRPAALDATPIKEADVAGAHLTIQGTTDRRADGEHYLKVHVLNRGLYQFSMPRFVQGHGLPAALVVNVQPTVGVDEPDYPFTTSREELKKTASKVVEETVEHLTKWGSANEVNALLSAFSDKIDVKGLVGHSIYDTSGTIPAALLEQLASHPAVPNLSATVGVAARMILAAVRQSGRAVTAFHFGGLGIDPSYVGVNISPTGLRGMAKQAGVDVPELGDLNIILYNPVAAWAERAKKTTGTKFELARHLAKDTFGTMVHEVAHQLAGGHDETFAGVLTRMSGEALDAAPAVLEQLTQAWTKVLDDEFTGLALDIEASSSKAAKNRLQKISGHQKPEAPEGRNDESEPAGQGRRLRGDAARRDATGDDARTPSGGPRSGSVAGAPGGAAVPGRGDRGATARTDDPVARGAGEDAGRDAGRGVRAGAGDDPVADLYSPAAPGTPLGAATAQAQGTSPSAQRAQAKRVKSLASIARALGDMVDVPVRQGRFNAKMRRAAGVFMPDQEVTRVLRFDRLDTVAHEVGHYISQHWLRNPTMRNAGSRGAQPLSIAMRRELVRMGKDLYGSRKPAGGYGEEGIAQWARFYVTEPARLATDAPKFSAWVDANVLAKEPALTAALDQARADFADYQAAPATARIDAMIDVKPQRRHLPDARTIATKMIDDLAEIRGAVEEIGGSVRPARNAYILARLTRGGAGMAEEMIERGIIDPATGTRVTKGIAQVLKQLDKKDVQRFRRYLVAERTLEVAQRGVNSGISVADAKDVVARYEKKFRPLAEELWAISNALIDYRQAKGLLTGPEAKSIKEKNARRVGFYRVFAEDEQAAGRGGTGKGFGRNSSGLQKMKGSARQIIDPLESIVTDVYKTVQQSHAADVLRALVRQAENTQGGGRVVEVLTEAPRRPVSIEVDRVKEQLAELGFELPNGGLTELPGVLTSFEDLRQPGPNETKDLVHALVINGTRTWIQIKDAPLYNALLGLGTPQMTAVMRWLSIPTRTLRAGATLTAEFIARNPVRDAFTAAVYSRAGTRPPGWDLGRGLFHVLRQDQMYQDWRLDGADNAAMLGLDRVDVHKHVRELMRSRGKAAADWVLRPIDTLRMLSSLFENATRVGEYSGLRKKLAKEGMPARDARAAAAIGSRDVTIDFARAGEVGRQVNQIMAFFNANVQGWDKLRRELRQNPGSVIPRILAFITIPSLLLYYLQKDDPAYQEVPAWQKALAWVIVDRDADGNVSHIWRIPKPPDLGILFGTIPERILDYAVTKDPRAVGQSIDALRTLNPLHIPEALTPVVEWMANYNFFTHRPIVPQGIDKLPAGEQSTSRTGELARIVGGTLHASPAKIENTVRGTAGGLGQYGMDIGNAIVRGGRKLLDLPALPRAQARRADAGLSTPGVKGFKVRVPQLDAQSVQDALDQFAEADAHRQAWRRKLEAGDGTGARRYFVEHETAIRSVAAREDRLGRPGYLRDAHALIIDAQRVSRDADDATRARVAETALRAARAALQGDKSSRLDRMRLRREANRIDKAGVRLMIRSRSDTP